MKKRKTPTIIMAGVALVLAACLFLACCGAPSATDGEDTTEGYRQISQDEAAEVLASGEDYALVDVRTQEEYASGHIPGAICIPNETIGTNAPQELPDRDQTILVYCRSGRRSKQAAEKLAAMGYTNVCEFGGINDWKGEVVTDDVVPGHAVTLSMESNPTTGFSWEAVQDEELFDISDEYVAEPQDEPVEGSGGTQVFTLTPKAAGTVQVTFTYTRPWEPSDADPQFTCTFEVGEDMRITVVDDGAGQAREAGYVPEMAVR